MAKSYGNLWPQFASWDNLTLASRRCRRRKRFKRGAIAFDFGWESNLLTLQRELDGGTYEPGPYRHFFIRDPKPRKISAAPFRDRIVHHAIVNVLEPLFERRFLHDSYACRRGKGTHRALDRAQHFLRRHSFVLQTDIQRFFPNVDHEILLDLLKRTIVDHRLLDLVSKIVASGEGIFDDETPRTWFPGDNLLDILRPTGLPIGNLTSQFFANVLLDPVDHFIKEQLRIPGYVRYADDLLLFADEKKVLWSAAEKVVRFLATLRLRLHSQKTVVHASQHGVKYLGFRLKPNGRRLAQQSVRRMRSRLRQQQRLFSAGEIDCCDVSRSLQAWLAHCHTANTTGLINDLLRGVRFHRSPGN
ncbi:Group II intron-encoded protein LtrA [Gimesia alba]|uniref:Group II intron-encoded protein LtrA n=1 Tax=Gimesia alba TaxID=2527973 RepID=A0A517R915_9PLAN|nr:reverse transcriptase domain-containing protein [Gimesia alba]QDT40341.1 Group II intron-encoded protein LtrA [Gimesia alba]